MWTPQLNQMTHDVMLYPCGFTQPGKCNGGSGAKFPPPRKKFSRFSIMGCSVSAAVRAFLAPRRPDHVSYRNTRFESNGKKDGAGRPSLEAPAKQPAAKCWIGTGNRRGPVCFALCRRRSYENLIGDAGCYGPWVWLPITRRGSGRDSCRDRSRQDRRSVRKSTAPGGRADDFRRSSTRRGRSNRDGGRYLSL